MSAPVSYEVRLTDFCEPDRIYVLRSAWLRTLGGIYSSICDDEGIAVENFPDLWLIARTQPTTTECLNAVEEFLTEERKHESQRVTPNPPSGSRIGDRRWTAYLW